MTDDFLTRFREVGPANPPGLQLLFADPPAVPADALMVAVRDYHPELADAIAEVETSPDVCSLASPDGPPPSTAAIVEWADHVVKVLLFPAPMPASAVEGCLRPALMPAEIKTEARTHRGHALLYYAGTHPDPLEQIAAVASVAGPLARFGGVVTLNEEARAAIPAFALLPDDPGEDMLHTLRTLPLPYLYAGFVKMDVENVRGVWVRTFAAHRFGLPDLATLLPDHTAGEATFRLFAAVLAYLRETGVNLELGETMRIDESSQYFIREPKPAEWWLDSPGPVRVLEVVSGEPEA